MINRWLGESPDYEYDQYLYIEEALTKGIVISKENLLFLKVDLSKKTITSPRIIQPQYRASEDEPLIHEITGGNIWQHDGFGKVGKLFCLKDVLEVESIDNSHVSLRLKELDPIRDEMKMMRKSGEDRKILIKEIVKQLEAGYLDSKGRSKLILSAFYVEVYENMNLIPKGWTPKETTALTGERLDFFKKKLEKQLERYKSGMIDPNISYQFLKHVMLEEYPFKEEQIHSYYQNCFKKKLHLLNIKDIDES